MSKLPVKFCQPLHWNDLRKEIETVFSEEVFNVWFQEMNYKRHNEREIEFTLPNDFATNYPIEVLPTPGGPRRQRIGPFLSFLSLRTARYSTMRFLTLSRP